ncbi:MAG: hypothetical protein J0L94_11695 [Rhodothermia bacterium]|nr:hypothetical protein [Rhodothermia bacterium]
MLKSEHYIAILTTVVTAILSSILTNLIFSLMVAYLGVAQVGVGMLSMSLTAVKLVLGLGAGIFVYNIRADVQAGAKDGALIGGVGVFVTALLSGLFTWVMMLAMTEQMPFNPLAFWVPTLLVNTVLGVILGAIMAALWPAKAEETNW